MNILLIPLDFHRHENEDIFKSLLVEFKNRFDNAEIYNSTNKLSFKPDVIYYQGGLSLEVCKEIKNRTKATWVTWTGDCKYFPTKSLQDLSEVTDIYMLPFSGELLKFHERMLGKRCEFIFEPFEDCKFIDSKNLSSGSVSYVGNMYHHLPGYKDRLECLEFIENYVGGYYFAGNITTKIGSYLGIDNSEVPKLYNESYISLAINNVHDVENYFTPRNLTILSAGGCALMKKFNGIENHFVNMEHCVYFNDKYDMLEAIDFLYRNPSIRNKIAISGHNHVKENYSMKNFVDQFIKNL